MSRTHIEALLRRIDQMKDSPINRNGGRPSKTIGQIIKSNLKINYL